MTTPLIVHAIHRLGVGGLENGLVNLINHLPRESFRHAIVCMTEATDFKARIRNPDVSVFELRKRDGQDWRLFLHLYRLFKELQPAILHTRNLATLECQLPAWLAGVPFRLHGEHGWDVFDPKGEVVKYQWLRRAFQPLIHRYIPLSEQLHFYLRDKVGVPERKIQRICNGVDTQIFYLAKNGKEPIPGCPFQSPDLLLIGTVGRMHGVKDQSNLVQAFIGLLKVQPQFRRNVRLVAIGDGPLRTQCQAMLNKAGLSELAWLPGQRDDIPRIMRGLDVFVLPSQAEGISNTLLEAMASGLPVVATAVGGNRELVENGASGRLVPPSDPDALAEAIRLFLEDQQLRRSHGIAALARVREKFSLERMVAQYLEVYNNTMGKQS